MEIKIPTRYYILKIMPTVCLSLLVGGLYVGYLLTFAIPLVRQTYYTDKHPYYYSDNDQFLVGVFYISVSGFFLFMLLFALIKTALVHPGKIPEGWNDRVFDMACQTYDIYSCRNPTEGLYKTNQLTISG
jgi:hypothetical protein